MDDTYLDTTQFKAYTQELARRLKVELPHVIDSETAAVMKLAASKHKPSKVGTIRTQTRLRIMAEMRLADSILTVNKKKDRGRIWFNSDHGTPGKWQILGTWDLKSANYAPANRRLKNADHAKARKVWNESKKHARAAAAVGIKSRGLSGKSWLKVIHLMGRTVEGSDPKSARIAPAIQKAIARTGRIYRNEAVFKRDTIDGYVVTVANSSPTTLRNRGKNNLQVAINTRRNFYKRNLKDGIFDNARTAATKYPGISLR